MFNFKWRVHGLGIIMAAAFLFGASALVPSALSKKVADDSLTTVSEESEETEVYAAACLYGISYPWAGTLWNRSSKDMKMRGDVHIGNNEYETRTYTLGPGGDSRNTDMCDVDHVMYDISPPDQWRYYLVNKNVGDWAKVSIARAICSDPPSDQENVYGVKCG